ncbi:MAG: SsrA-binding protein SmpB [Candidatus Pacebacteria bacterium]|nr:SsrA-binding protein SmpB [Candidatus Paceibacterota bacterium]
MILLENKKVRLRYSVLETYSAGMELLGGEVKSLRAHHGSLDGARIIVRAGEAYLIGATIPPYQIKNTPENYDPERTRRILLSKKEIAELADAESKKGLTIVPLEVYNNRYVKLRIAIVKGKSKVDKREDLKKADAARDIDRALKTKGRV